MAIEDPAERLAPDRVHAAVARAEAELVGDLVELVNIPSVSATGGPAIDRAARFVAERLERAGLTARIEPTAGHPVVVGVGGPPDARFELLVYGHYDVVPAQRSDGWDTDPFDAVVADGRVWGRGTGDNKGQLLAQIHGLRLARELRGGELPIRVTMIVEGEEEVGSPNLEPFVAAHADELRADLCFYSDGPMFPGDRPCMVFGVRGAVVLELVARGARRDLHSGNFGGVAPHPVLELCHLIAAIAGPAGELIAPAARADVPEPARADLAALAALPFDGERIQAELGVEPVTGDSGPDFHRRLQLEPSLNVSGIAAGYVGEGYRPTIPHRALAKLDVRLVGSQDPDDVVEWVRATARERGLDGIEVRRLSGYPGSRTPVDHPYAAVVARAIEHGFGQRPLAVPSLGGTTPEHVFTSLLGCPTVMVPYAPHDESNHAPNERMSVPNYLHGIATTALLVDALATTPRQVPTPDDPSHEHWSDDVRHG